jgi:hypothetical protein
MGPFLERNDGLDKSGDTRHSGPSTREGEEAKKSQCKGKEMVTLNLEL